MIGEAEQSPGAMAAWAFGFLIIALILIVAIYMFVKYLKSEAKKNKQADQQHQLEEERSYRQRVAETLNQSDSSITTDNTIRETKKEPVVKAEKSEKSRKSEKSEKAETSNETQQLDSSLLEEYSARDLDEEFKKNIDPNKSDVKQPAPKSGSNELSSKEISAKKSLTDVVVKPEKPKISSSETAVEINVEEIITPAINSKPNLSSEKASDSSIGSEASTYLVSSQRSEMNNYNMQEAGRTPPTFSKTENMHDSIVSYSPISAPPSTMIATSTTMIPSYDQRRQSP